MEQLLEVPLCLCRQDTHAAERHGHHRGRCRGYRQQRRCHRVIDECHGQPQDGRQGDQHSCRNHEEHIGPEQERDEGESGDAPRWTERPLDVVVTRPLEVCRDLDDLGAHQLGLVDDLGVDLGIHGLEVEAREEHGVVSHGPFR